MHDDCLERSRRQAWARYFRAREDAEQMAWWAAEIGEWFAQIGGVPPEVTELIDLARAALPAGGTDTIARYVKRRLELTAA